MVRTGLLLCFDEVLDLDITFLELVCFGGNLQAYLNYYYRCSKVKHWEGYLQLHKTIREKLLFFGLNYNTLSLDIIIGKHTANTFHFLGVIPAETQRILLDPRPSGKIQHYIRGTCAVISAKIDMWYVVVVHDSRLVGSAQCTLMRSFGFFQLVSEEGYHQVFNYTMVYLFIGLSTPTSCFWISKSL